MGRRAAHRRSRRSRRAAGGERGARASATACSRASPPTPETGGFTARVIKLLERPPKAALGIYPRARRRRRASCRSIGAASELTVSPERRERRDGRRARLGRGRRRRPLRPPLRARRRTHRRCLQREGDQPHRARGARHPPRLPARRARRRRRRPSRPTWRTARTGASCRSSPSIRPMRATMTMPSIAEPDPESRGGFIVTVAIADVAWYVRPGSELDREARAARQFGLFPRPRRADAAGAHLQRPLLAARRRGRALPSPCGCASTPRAESSATASTAS